VSLITADDIVTAARWVAALPIIETRSGRDVYARACVIAGRKPYCASACVETLAPDITPRGRMLMAMINWRHEQTAELMLHVDESGSIETPHNWSGSIGPRITIGAGAIIGALVSIRPGAVIHGDCVIGDGSMIFENARIGSRAYVGTSSMIGPGSVIGALAQIAKNALIKSGVVIGDRVNIGPGVKIKRGSRIASGVTVPGGAVVPKNSIITDDAERLRNR